MMGDVVKEGCLIEAIDVRCLESSNGWKKYTFYNGLKHQARVLPIDLNPQKAIEMVISKPPAVIFVVRHGARLDAADKEWHLTSPTPYDAPLTYGGWTQCRALGARIASILLEREAAFLQEQKSVSDSQDGTNGSRPKRKRKKHRIILHSSPFLRCTQTSTAIAAGMSQFHGMQNEIRAQQNQSRTGTPPRTRGHAKRKSDLETIHDEDHDLECLQNLPIKPFPKLKLRIDAFLGEWNSPEYYEHITHPPNSILMLAGAKAELLHRAEPAEGLDSNLEVPKPNFFPGGWGSPSTQPGTPVIESKDKELQLPDISNMRISRSPTRSRATTVIGPGEPPRSVTLIPRLSVGGYMPPTPRYPLLPTDPIPRGYTGHARDACIDVDYAWDSTRPPQNWGNGGEYGEEWSSMHKRFRSGIARMVNWYRLHHESPFQYHGHLRALHPVHEEDTDQDCEVDTVLILVTHGAGCNALIGALTDQPVLMDIAMASLTMALRKDQVQGSTNTGVLSHPPSATALSFAAHGPLVSEEYAVSITASIDHLRTGANPLSIPILQDPAIAYESLPSKPKTSSRTVSSMAHPRYKLNRSTMVKDAPLDGSMYWSSGSGPKYGGVQRSASAISRSSTAGLWSVPQMKQASEQVPQSTPSDLKKGELVSDDNGPTQVDGQLTRTDSGPTQSQVLSSTRQSPNEQHPGTAALGLWPARESDNIIKSSPGLWSAQSNSTIPSGPPNRLPLEVCERSAAAKRRWTVNENRGE